MLNFKRSGRKRKFTNRNRYALFRLVKTNRRLNVRDITLKLNECKAQTFSEISVKGVYTLKIQKKVSEKESGGSGSKSQKASRVV